MMLTGIEQHQIRRSAKDARRRVLWIVASYLGLEGETRKAFEFPWKTKYADAVKQIPKEIQ